MRRRRWVAGAAIALGLAAALSGGGDATGRARGSAATPDSRTAAPVPARAAPGLPGPAVHPDAPKVERPRGVRDPMWGQDPTVVADPLEAYLITSVYPPQSRPLGRHNDDLLHPNQRHEEFVDSDDGAVDFRFTAVTGDETLVATLEVRRDGRPVPVTVTTAFLAPYRAAELPSERARWPVPFEPQGELQVGRSRPAAIEGRDETGLVGLYIEFDHGGAERQRAHLVVHVTPEAAVPARFTGEFRDEIVNGSLVVYAGVEVRQGGHYLVDCNLYDAEDHPVAWTRFKGHLDAGVHMVPLTFFGKVLVDSRATAPFRLGELRGARFVEGRDPDLDQMRMFTGEYHTASYPLGDFSDAPYDSPEKQRRIELLTEARDRGRFGPR
jgi:hypothetical protein